MNDLPPIALEAGHLGVATVVRVAGEIDLVTDVAYFGPAALLAVRALNLLAGRAFEDRPHDLAPVG